MDECSSPFIESSSLMPEDLSIPDDPDIPYLLEQVQPADMIWN